STGARASARRCTHMLLERGWPLSLGLQHAEGSRSMIPQWVLLISPFIGVVIVAFAVAVISRVDPVVVLRPAETRDTADYDELVRKTADTLGRGGVTIIRPNLVPFQSLPAP